MGQGQAAFRTDMGAAHTDLGLDPGRPGWLAGDRQIRLAQPVISIQKSESDGKDISHKRSVY